MRIVGVKRPLGILVVVLLVLPLLTHSVTAVAPANDAFQRTWERTDQPVASGQVSRTWMWGPDAFTGLLVEEYVPVGLDITEREVQYFDKSRMEITNPAEDSSSIWYVTNGLLVRELMTGEMQVGDQEWVTRFPAEVNVAGDADDPDGPTYATFAEHSFPASVVPSNEGAAVMQRIERSGAITDDSALAAHGVTTTRYVPETGHHVASVFWAFMQAEGVIYEDGEFSSGALFPNEFYATGFPISEPYWATVRVGGTPRDVLVQCFDRRCLTYTPDNPEGWQVEAGNVGQHYYTWRYETDEHPSVEEPEPVYRMAYIHRVIDGTTWTRTIYTMNSDGTGQQPIGLDPNLHVLEMSLSPDGQTIAFTAWDERNDGYLGTQVYAIGIDGGDLQDITELENNRQPSSVEWSPDGSQIVFTSWENGVSGQQYSYVYTVSRDGSVEERLTGDGEWASYAAWSPDGTKLAFASNRDCVAGAVRCIWVMNADGTEPELIVQSSGTYIGSMDWSPDGSEILYAQYDLGGEEPIARLFATASDGSAARFITEAPGLDQPRWDPSSERIFFAGRRHGNWDIFMMDRDGSNEQRMTDGEHDEYAPSPPSR